MGRTSRYVTCHTTRSGSANGLTVTVLAAAVVLAVTGYMLFEMDNPPTADRANELFLYCAAGIRPAIEPIAADYQREFGTRINLQIGGSNTLLSQIEIAGTGDLYLAADNSYIELAQERGIVAESIPLAWMRPVIAVAKGNPKNISTIDDLLRGDVVTALGNPDETAVGKKTRELLKASGHWERLEQHVTQTGVTKPIVPAVANVVKLGSAEAGIIWDATANQYDELEIVATPELDVGRASITIGVLASASNPPAALHFARYAAARDRGLQAFASKGYDVVEGDVWQDVPEITFFCGSVNRRAVEPVLEEFQQREGVVINTLYNGCGILTGQMRTIVDQKQSAFPDTYMACDVYYLDTVREMFQEAVNVSDTEVVIAVQKGNPRNITEISDLTQPGLRVAVGQPEQCTIGILTREILESEGIHDAMMANVVTETVTSAAVVPTVVTGSVDAAFVYATDTLAERDKLEVVRISSKASKAVQPFSIARSSDQKHLARRLFAAISRSRQSFESAGFHWRLNGETAASTAPGGSGGE